MSNTTFNNITIFKKKFKNNNYINKNYNINKIKMWTGNNPPTGYVWCDGNNGTPNLKNKFIYFINNTSNTMTNIGSNTINEMPLHNHNVSNVSTVTDINATTNELKINYIYYRTYNKTGARQGGVSCRRTGSDNEATHKTHTHNIDNDGVNATYIRDEITIDNLSFNPNLEKNNNFNTDNIISSNGVQQGSSIENFEPKYIYIGFIMKDPTT